MSENVTKRLRYYQRIFSAYLGGGTSQLSFWHDEPQPNPNLTPGELGEYYMGFEQKADYGGPFDDHGIPMLDYRGALGLQYNPIAIAQYGLGNYNLFVRTKDTGRREKYLRAAEWLGANLERNPQQLWVWNHHFDWDYRDTLKAPWYSGLAQGQGISLLLRAHRETQEKRYLEATTRAFESFFTETRNGGVRFADEKGQVWIEEYIVHPPTHILNGFIWAAWGIYDYAIATGDARAKHLWESCLETIAANLASFDTGFWSLYELSGTRLAMLASPFYHRLHIAQLQVMHRLTGREVFRQFAERWQAYARNPLHRRRALAYKAAFKLLYY